jgi:hypothetical protein
MYQAKIFMPVYLLSTNFNGNGQGKFKTLKERGLSNQWKLFVPAGSP